MVGRSSSGKVGKAAPKGTPPGKGIPVAKGTGPIAKGQKPASK